MHLKALALFYFLIISTDVLPTNIYVWLSCIEEYDTNTWESYKQILTKNNGYIIEFNSDNSIPAIAEKLYRTKISLIEGNNDVILIGPSMAGLVARSIQLLSPNVKGIITVGTAHSGSTLLKNLLTGEDYDYFSKTIRMINVAIDNSTLVGFSTTSNVRVITEAILLPINTLHKTFVASSLNIMKVNYQKEMGRYATSQQCIKDMLPNSTYLKNMNSISTRIPIINIYGSEDYWPVIRTLGTKTYHKIPKQPKDLGKVKDTEFIVKIQSALGFISQIQNGHNLVYNALALPAILNPMIWQKRELVHNAKSEWEVVYRYLETGIHADFAKNIGAVEYRLQNYCVPDNFAINQWICKRKYLPFILENDGFISRTDVFSNLLPGVNASNIKVIGVNHNEIGNHIEIRKLLDRIINKRTYGEIFSK